MGCGASIGRTEDFSSFYSNYRLGKALGKGSYGYVFLAKARYSQNSYAVKVQTSRRTAAKKIEHEAKIWKLSATHRNVVHFLQMCQEADIYFMVMEACQCSLFDRLIDNPKWVWEQLVSDLHQLVAGLQHLHSRRVLHSDIKAENALYGGSDGKTLKLADFGLAVYITPAEGPLTRARGSRSYMAPEMLAGEGYNFPADMWSFGVLVYVLLVGQFPIGQSKQTKSELTRNIIRVEREPARLTNLANKLKRTIASEQGKLDKRRLASEKTGSSVDFARIAPSSEGEGSAAAEDLLTRHVSVQMKRLKVVEFIRLFLQRNPLERRTATEAMQAELFLQAPEENPMLVINRRPLKRTDAKEEPKLEKDKDSSEKEKKTDPKEPTSQKPETPLPPAPAVPREEPKPPPLRRRSLTTGASNVEEDSSPKPTMRRRSLSGLDNADTPGMQRLQVPKFRPKPLRPAEPVVTPEATPEATPEEPKVVSGLASPSPSDGGKSPSTMMLEVQEKETKPLEKPAERSRPRAGSGGIIANASDSDLNDRGSMVSATHSRMSRMSSLRMRSSMGMLSRDQSGFDLLHQLAANSDPVGTSWNLQDSALFSTSNNGARLARDKVMRSMGSRGSNNDPSELHSHLGNLISDGAAHPESDNRTSQSRADRKWDDADGPTPSRLQRRVSYGEASPPSLRRRVSFDEVLCMQHMVPNQMGSGSQ